MKEPWLIPLTLLFLRDAAIIAALYLLAHL